MCWQMTENEKQRRRCTDQYTRDVTILNEGSMSTTMIPNLAFTILGIRRSIMKASIGVTGTKAVMAEYPHC